MWFIQEIGRKVKQTHTRCTHPLWVEMLSGEQCRHIDGVSVTCDRRLWSAAAQKGWSCHHPFNKPRLSCWCQKERLINTRVLSCVAFVNFISFYSVLKAAADGERVRALQSPIGPIRSHARFLIPPRTLCDASSPHTGSDQTQITGQLLALD